MVRCSIKRAIRIIIILVILIIIYKNFPSYSRQTDVNKPKEKSPVIVILSLYNSKTIQRLILFLNELRLLYIEYKNLDESFYHDLLNNIPSLIILDYTPQKEFYTFTNRYEINLVIILNNQCENCISIKYSQMLVENLTYPTIDFDREEIKPILRTTQSPFQINQSNKIIKLLRFKKLLPYFHQINHQCLGLATNTDDPIIYVQNKQTSEQINLMILSKGKHIYVSECLYHHWFIWPIMMDIIRYLTLDKYDYYGLNRYIQIDIDDIFLGGKSNDRLRVNDIQSLIRSQLFIRNYVSNFRYRLGFSGYFNDEDDEGDRLLIREYYSFKNYSKFYLSCREKR
jgi:hypothetical protein